MSERGRRAARPTVARLGRVQGRLRRALPDAESVSGFIRAILDRAAAYTYPPAARALAEGLPVRLTRRGWIDFYIWRQRYRPPIDHRAVEVEIAVRRDIFEGDDVGDPDGGLTLAEFAEWVGVDRRTIRQHVEEIPTGPAPPLPQGKVPARRIGGVIRVLLSDFRGEPAVRGVHDGADRQEASPGSAARETWHRQVDRLRRR